MQFHGRFLLLLEQEWPSTGGALGKTGGRGEYHSLWMGGDVIQETVDRRQEVLDAR
jgi:hypothetical protein